MTVATRSAMLQARVYPAVKRASEDVLRRMGLTMTEAVELFLRRVIVDQKIPFDIVALDEATWSELVAESPKKVGPITGSKRHKRTRMRPGSRGG